MITRCSVFPPAAHDPAAPPPLHAVGLEHRGQLPARGGLAGGAVVFTGIPSTPGGSSGFGYLGMDITDPGSWPRPFNPQQTAAWFCAPQVTQ
jgi:hypothetical protein